MGDADPSTRQTPLPIRKPTISTEGTAVSSEATRESVEAAKRNLKSLEIPVTNTSGVSPPSPNVTVNHFLYRKQTSLDLDDYFAGPRDINKHSKWPMMLQMHGSILPQLIVPLFILGGWSALITGISMKVHDLSVNSVLLTITGFVVGLSLSFRNSTAYERYAEGRRYWAVLTMACQSLGRVFWIHGGDREEEDPRETMLKKISSMNLLVAFSVALKHALRFEPYTCYPDLQHLIGHLDTFAKDATAAEPEILSRRKNFFKSVGGYLGVSFAASNPRKALKKTDRHLGNLPLEILSHIAIAIDEMSKNGQLPVGMTQTIAYNQLTALNDVMQGCERILNTPLPIAYGIAISQITYVYIILLPFQLVGPLQWIAIPATVAAAYIILGLLFTAQEIENPFGNDVNDLPLEIFCDQIANDMDVIASYDKRKPDAFLMHQDNMPLYPVSTANAGVWMQRSEEKLQQAIRDKPKTLFEWRRSKAIRKAAELKMEKGDHNV